MKNMIHFFTAACIVSSFALNATLPSQTGLQVQVDQTKSSTSPNSSGTMTDGVNVPKPATGPTEPTTPLKGTDLPNTPEDAKKGEFISDHDLAKEIYKAIREDRLFSNDSKIKIQVTVYNGKVTLSGDVKSEAEKARAELLANQLNKLKGVVNNIRVVK